MLKTRCQVMWAYYVRHSEHREAALSLGFMNVVTAQRP
jgi:hypothetical protein